MDYFGISNFLEEALLIFDKEELGQPMQSTDGIYKQMLSYRESVMGMFTGIDKNNLDALVKVLEPEDKGRNLSLHIKGLQVQWNRYFLTMFPRKTSMI